MVRLLHLTFAASLGESSSCQCARNHDFAPVNDDGAADGRPAGTAGQWWLLGYQVPLTQPPFTPVVGVHVRVVAPLRRVIENVLPSVETAVTV